jgi:hypothetical protein
MAVDQYSTSFDLPIGYDGFDGIVIVGAIRRISTEDRTYGQGECRVKKFRIRMRRHLGIVTMFEDEGGFFIAEDGFGTGGET